jgi:hypothetical protein
MRIERFKGRLEEAGLAAILLAGLALAAVLTVGGCATAAEKQFAGADMEARAEYISQAQPAVEGYCDALAKQGLAEQLRAEQIRSDTRALAAALTANGQTWLRSLNADQQLVANATQALLQAIQILEQLKTERQVKSVPASQPAD